MISTVRIMINPKYAEAYLKRGFVYKELGKTNQAIESYNKAIEINSQYAAAYSALGLVYVLNLV